MSPWLLYQVCHCLAQGGVIAYPTEAVYGLGCDPDNFTAVLRLLDIKQRPWRKGLILLGADLAQFSPYILPLSAEKVQKITAPRQRPVTWLVPARMDAPYWLTGESDLLAVRVAQHPVASRLCRLWGKPLVSTSANRAGLPALKTATQVRHQWGQRLDWIVNAPVGGQNRPSEIRNVLSDEIIRY